MDHGQNGGSQKNLNKALSKNSKLNKNIGIFKFCGNRGKFINFAEIRGIGLCNVHHWFGDGRPWSGE